MSSRIEPLSDFDFLASFAGEPGVFWPRWCLLARARFEADGACLLLQAGQRVDAVRVVAQDRPSSAQRVVQSGVVADLGKLIAGGVHVWTPRVMVLSMPGSGVASPQLWLVLLDAICEDTEGAARELRLLAKHIKHGAVRAGKASSCSPCVRCWTWDSTWEVAKPSSRLACVSAIVWRHYWAAVA